MEYVEVLGGVDSELFREFKTLFLQGFESAQKHCESIISKSSMNYSCARDLRHHTPHSFGRVDAKRLDTSLFCCFWRPDCSTIERPIPTRSQEHVTGGVCGEADFHVSRIGVDEIV